MAKRKRLTPASPAFLETAPEIKSALGSPLQAAPIAHVARDASASAMAEELAQTLADARAQGRMVISVPLDDLVLDHLVRDRVATQDDDMQSLIASLRARGQQTPVEVQALDGARYGLISGWRRCMALRALHDETGEARFGEVLCLVRQPAEHADAYVAMVEENEIRAGLSYFERARIVAKSVEQGVFDSDRSALRALFQSASRAKRSKIGSFLTVVRALDGALRFPQALGERQGLQLARRLAEDTGFANQLRLELAQAQATAPDAENAVLARVLSTGAAAQPARAPSAAPSPAPKVGERVVGGVHMTYEDGRLVLEGRAVTDALRSRLVTWLRQNV